MKTTIFYAFTIILVFQTDYILCAFVANGISATSKLCCSSSQVSRLQAIALPAEQEDEKQKKRNKDSTTSTNDWTTTKGGFIPNFLTRKKSTHPKVHLVDNIHDYKDIVADEKHQIVVVRFFASWCRSCKATKPLFSKLVKTFSDSSVKFVEVPLTKETQYLHEGLGVPSVPFAHIYHPEAGLVDEVKISKPHFSKFVEKLNCYVVGSCDLPEEENVAIGTFE